MGCYELLVELQARLPEFQKRDAVMVVLGSKPESMELARQKAAENKITYPLLYDATTNTEKKLGLWSEMMQMPWMGYMIIDRSGRVVASDLQLSEAKGASPSIVRDILRALDKARATAGG